jgi:hypothetical protein
MKRNRYFKLDAVAGALIQRVGLVLRGVLQFLFRRLEIGCGVTISNL